MKKITISGCINAEFVGNDKDCFIFLNKINEAKNDMIGADLIRAHFRENPQYSSKMLTDKKYCERQIGNYIEGKGLARKALREASAKYKLYIHISQHTSI